MDFTEAQNEVVRSVAGSADMADWERLLADVEILEHPGDYQIDYICLAVCGEGDALELRQFRLSAAARDAITSLYRQRKEEAGDVIGGFELTIDRSGRFRFAFLNGPPQRINGNWDAERAQMLNNYLDIYRAELAATR